jgi:hypothetical protein
MILMTIAISLRLLSFANLSQHQAQQPTEAGPMEPMLAINLA